MSTLKENVQKVVDANAAIKAAIAAKGVAVPAAAKLSDAATLIAAIAGATEAATTWHTAWASAKNGVLALSDATLSSVNTNLAGDVVIVFPSASDRPRFFSLCFVAGEGLAFAWPANVSFRSESGISSFEVGNVYVLTFGEVSSGVFVVRREQYGAAFEAVSNGAWLAAEVSVSTADDTIFEDVANAADVKDSDATTAQGIIDLIK